MMADSAIDALTWYGFIRRDERSSPLCTCTPRHRGIPSSKDENVTLVRLDVKRHGGDVGAQQGIFERLSYRWSIVLFEEIIVGGSAQPH